MLRSRNTIIATLLGLAVIVSVVTAVNILTLPTVGSVRHAVGAKGSALSDLRATLRALGFVQADGTIQHLISTNTSTLSFRGATYWTSSDIDTRRNNDLGAGGTVALVLVLSALALTRRTVVQPASRSSGSQRA